MSNPQLTDDEFNLAQTILLERSGLYFSRERDHNLAYALAERARAKGSRDFGEYLRSLDLSPAGEAEFRQLLELVTIGETYFFRNHFQFEAFGNDILGQLIASRLFTTRKLTLWSAGCSTGEEAYTLAIILREKLPAFENWRITILATDINQQVLKLAAEGYYSSRSVGRVPPEYLEKYFTKEGARYRLNPEIKEMVTFKLHNMVTEPFDQPEMQEVDAIFCRNVIIYFAVPTIKKVVDKIYNLLPDGGYLFLGYSESLWQIDDRFSTIEFPHTFVYRKELNRSQTLSHPLVALPEFVLPEESRLVSAPAPDYMLPPPPREDVKPQVKKALAIANQGDYQAAIAELETIIGRDNLCLECYYLSGVLYEKVGQLAAAIRQFKKTVYIEPDFALGYYNLANIYFFQGEKLNAKREFSNAIKILRAKPAGEVIPFTENLTVDLLLTTCQRALDLLG